MDKIAVLIPCYNEETTIGKVIRDFKKVLPDAKIYVYDNNSIDKTALVAKKEGAITRNEYKQGKGNVVRKMFYDIDALCYILVDGDDTYSAKHAKEMADYILSGNYDMVIGDRLSLDYFKENKRIFHGFGNKLVRKLINIIFKSNINDIMTGYRAFSYRFVKTFPILSRGFEIETEMTIHALDKNISIKEIPVNYKDRPSGSISKLNTFKDGIKVLKTIFNLFIEYKPLTFFAIISILLMTGSLVMFIPVLNEYLQTGLVPKFPTLIVSVFLSIIAILLLMCGIILNVVIKKDRKLYEYFNLSIKTKK